MEVDTDSGIGVYDSVYHRTLFFLDIGRYSSYPTQQDHRSGYLASSPAQCCMEFYPDHGRNHGEDHYDVLLFLIV